MARITIAAAIGDLSVPALLAALAFAGLGWRAGFVAAGAVAAGLAAAHASSRSLDVLPVADSHAGHAGEGSEEGHPGVRAALLAALLAPSLLAWSLACTATNLLDEVLVAFSALELAAMGATPGERSAALAAWVCGDLVGLAALERIAGRVAPRRILAAASVVSAVAIAWLALARSPASATTALAVLGVAGSTLHPLAKARAYEALPGRPALVNAAAAALVPLDAAAPVVLGIIAARLGPRAAVAALLVAPAAILAVAWRERGRR